MKVAHNVPLADHTSLKAGGAAATLITLDDHDHLQEAIAGAATEGPLWILGYGSNCLVSDKGLPGTVIMNRSGDLEQLSPTRFRADSGLNWDDMIQKVIAKGLWGLEFSSGIPGGVGAAICGNIAAYGHKVADCFVEATIYNPHDDSVTVQTKDFFGFDYRSSNLQKPENQHLVVLDATFEFSANPTGNLEYQTALKTAEQLGIKPDSLENRRKIIMETRRKAGSLLQDRSSGPWTAGSFFKNPVVTPGQIQAIIQHEEADSSVEQVLRQSQIHTGSTSRVSAAHVLLAAGFQRGQTWGQVRLHPDHILKVENLGKATAQEMYDVVQEILQTVKDRLNISLEPEVRFLGEF